MIEFAVVKCKLSPQTFWALSWFEWNLYVERYRDDLEKEKATDEIEWLRTRALWVPIMNAHFKKQGGYRGTDLIVLSFDKREDAKEEKPLSFQEVKKLLGSRIKKR